MKSIVGFIVILSALLFIPSTFIEDCESPKAWLIIAFSCFALFYVNWKKEFIQPIGIMLLAFVGSAIVSTFKSIDIHRSFGGDPHIPNGLILLIAYVIFYGVVKQTFKNFVDRCFLVNCIIFTAAVVSVYAILQVFGIDFLKWSGFPVDGNYIRPPSTLGHPNYMASYLSMVLPFVLWAHDKTPSVRKLQRVGMRVIQIAIVAAICLSQSRGAWLATLASVSFYFLKSGQFKKKFGLFIAGCIAVFSIVFFTAPNFRENAANRIETIINPGSIRFYYNTAAIKIWKKHPWFGCGTDAYATAFPPERNAWYWINQPGGAPTRAHNEFLNILATQGLLGFGIYSCWLVIIYITYRRSVSLFAMPAAASLISFFVFNLSGFPIVSTNILFMICLVFLAKETDWFAF